jgi:hypothetical protein
MASPFTAGVCRRIFNVAAVTTLMTAAFGAYIWTHQDDGERYDLDQYRPQIMANIQKNDPTVDLKAADEQLRDTTFKAELFMRTMALLFTGLSLGNTLHWRNKMKEAESPRPGGPG